MVLDVYKLLQDISSFRRSLTMKGGDTMANFQPLSFSNIQMPQFKSAAREILEAQESENASEFYKRLMHYIKEFDTSLDQEHEVGVRLVNFGQTIQFAV